MTTPNFTRLRKRGRRRPALLAVLATLLLAPVAHACPPGSADIGACNTGSHCCRPCAAGYFSANGVSCLACGPGTVASGPHSSFCPACVGGTVANGKHTQCVQCSGGTVPNGDHSTCAACSGDTVPNPAHTACITCPIPMVPNAKHTACVVAVLPHATTPGLLEPSPALPPQGPASTGTPLRGGGPTNGTRGPASVR